MVIGPNRFFINYISNVLPDLDASNAVQVTYEELASDFTCEKLIFEDSTKKLSDIIDKKAPNDYLKFKSSLKYKELLEKYLNNYEKTVISDAGVIINNIQVLSKDEVMETFNEVIGECLEQRLDMTARVLSNRIKNDDTIYNRVKNRMLELEKNEENIDKKRKIAKQELNMLKDLTNTGFEKQIKKYVSISNLKSINIYKDFVENVDKLYLENDVDINSLKENTLKSLKSRIIENEDIAAIMFIRLYLFGNGEYKNIKCVVIDEAQDFGIFSYFVLKKLLSNATFSIFGDMAQGIYSYRAIGDWNEIKENVIFDAEFLNLKKSYRTSIEIMNEANKVSEAIGLGRANPVIRSSGPIIKTNIEKDKEALYIVNRVKEYQSQGFKSIAIVYKDQTNMMELNRLLKKEKIESEIIYKDQEKYNGGVCILTSYLSKGLEFDVVIIADADDSIYLSNNILDMKLLYVAMTRALHKLELIYNNNICKYLK